MLEDDCGWFIHQVFDDIEAVIHIGQVDLTWMFADLQHILNRNAAYQGVARLDKFTVCQSQVSIDQFVKGGLLIRVFPITQATFIHCAVFHGDAPGTFSIDQSLIVKRNGHLHGKRITKNGCVHFFDVAHGRSTPLNYGWLVLYIQFGVL